MPNTTTELPFRLNIGMDSYDPAISEGDIKVSDLTNLHPKYNRLYANTKQEIFQTMTGDTHALVCSFAEYVLDNKPAVSLYALAHKAPYNFDTASQLFVQMTDVGLTPYEWTTPNFDPFAYVPWGDTVYVTRRAETVAKLTDSIVTPDLDTAPDVPTGNLSARYMIESSGHLMLLNMFETGADQTLRIRWSDLNDPENFTDVVGLGGESDSYTLNRHSGFITGASNQRGYTIIYTYNDIWRATYTPGRTVQGVLSPYTFEAVLPGIGNVYHYAMVSVKNIDFFIGQDNFYILDGLKTVPIGDPIWKYFKETQNNISINESVFAHVDEAENEIFWLYPTTIPNKDFWSVVYNYKENRWSTRDPQNMYASYLPPVRTRTFFAIDDFGLTGYGPIDTFDGQIPPGGDEATTYIDGSWQFQVIPFEGLYGGASTLDAQVPEIYGKSNKFAFFDETPMECSISTFELNANTFLGVKEFPQLKFLYQQTGFVDVKLIVSTRDNQAEPFVDSDVMLLSDQLEGVSEFFFDNFGVGEFVKFRLFWENTDTNYIDEVYGLALKVRTPLSSDVEK